MGKVIQRQGGRKAQEEWPKVTMMMLIYVDDDDVDDDRNGDA